MPSDVTIEGLAEFESKWASECEVLEKDIEGVALHAATEGVEAAKRSHPYTDRTYKLTDTARAEPGAKGAAMVWPQKYASFVDQGTSRARAYPFAPVALARAEIALTDLGEDALVRFVTRMGSGF